MAFTLPSVSALYMEALVSQSKLLMLPISPYTSRSFPHALNKGLLLKIDQTLIAAGSLWGTCVLAVQLSILNLYLRLFGVMRWHRMCCYVVMGLCCAWWIAFFGILMADCIPLRKLWTQNIPGKCVNQKTFCGSTGIAHIILDFIILVLPIPVIWNLKIARSRKVLISIILTLGVLYANTLLRLNGRELILSSATICSSLRIGCFVALVKVSESDLTLSSWMSYLFESLEVMTGILCLCLPTLPSLYAHVRSSRFGSYIKSLLNSRVSTSRLNSSPSNVWKARSKKYSRSSPESSGFHTMGHSDSHLVATTTANVEHDPSDIPLPDLAAHGTQVTKSWQVESHNAHNHV